MDQMHDMHLHFFGGMNFYFECPQPEYLFLSPLYVFLCLYLSGNSQLLNFIAFFFFLAENKHYLTVVTSAADPICHLPPHRQTQPKPLGSTEPHADHTALAQQHLGGGQEVLSPPPRG